MKKPVALILAVILLALSAASFAAEYVVNVGSGLALGMRSEKDDQIIIYIPDGTRLAADEAKSTETSAYVSFMGVAGFVPWESLKPVDETEEKPEAAETETAAESPAENGAGAAPTPAPRAEKPANPVVTVVNAVVRKADARGRAEGAEQTSVTIAAGENVYIASEVPRGNKLTGWIINGVPYTSFSPLPKKFAVLNVTEDLTVEAVLSKADPRTALTAEEIQAGRTGEKLIVSTKRAQLCHVKDGKDGKKGAGGWITEFDFTEDYVNRATGLPEKGGRVTAKISAVIPKGKKISGWLFNETEFRFTAKTFVVSELNRTMTYEPLFGKAAEPTKAPEEKKKETVYYTVSCYHCSFSGGGYSGATSGKVPAGTVITVKPGESNCGGIWDGSVNKGSVDNPSYGSIKVTVNSNKQINWWPIYN